MIALRLGVEPLPIIAPLVLRLRDDLTEAEHPADAVLISSNGTRREYDFNGFSVVFDIPAATAVNGDVVMLLPGQKSAHRLIRADSRHNTFLVTEQCDQLCVMCSQPPKKHHLDLFEAFATAATLAPRGAYIGISGGEPLLHKERLFGFLRDTAAARPDLRFHVLTNAQHFTEADMGHLDAIGLDRILWGIPLYSADPDTHDTLVGKAGAFRQLEASLNLLMRVGASVELRTVVMRDNVAGLPDLARTITTRLPFIDVWAIMQLENIGYGRMNWHRIFQDTSVDFEPVKAAINHVTAKGFQVALYNFPLCSIPADYRPFAPSTISDWKRKYLDFCEGCSARAACGGFFEWYSHPEGFSGLGPL